MKRSIHPQYNSMVVTCNSCGKSFAAGSTHNGNISIDVCSNCHPFFTGKQKIVDIANKAKDFAKKQEAAKVLQEKIASIKANKEKRMSANITHADPNAPTSLKDMIKILKQNSK